MNINFDDILSELRFRVEGGVIDLTNKNQIDQLSNILNENGITDAEEVANRARVYFSYINEADKSTKENDILNKVVKYKDAKGNDHEILVKTALTYKDSKNQGQKLAYQAAQKLLNKKAAVKPTPAKPAQPKKIGAADFKAGAEKAKVKAVKPDGLNLKPVEVDKRVGALKHIIQKDFAPELQKNSKLMNILTTGFGKLISGQQLSGDELKVLKNHIAIKDKAGEAVFYVATKTPGDFKKHKKVEFGATKEKALRDLADKVGLSHAKAQEGALGKKELVANKISTARKKINPVVQKDGSVKIEGVIHKQMSVPSAGELTKELKKNGVENPEEEAKLTVNSIKRYNKQIEMLKNTKDFEVVDFGDTSTPEGRKKTFANVKLKMTGKFEELLKREGPLTKEHVQILDELKNIKFNDNGSNPNFEKNIDDWFSKMTMNKDFRTAAPDLLEIMVFSKMLGRGYHAFLPSSETFKVSDVVAFKEPTFKVSKEKSPAKQVADNFKMIKTSLIMVGGSSVKFAEGGAGQSDSKVEQTEYKNKETKGVINNLLKTHQFVYGKSKDGKYPPPTEAVQKKEKEIMNYLRWAVSAGIISKVELNSVLEEGTKQAKNLYETAKRNNAGPFNKKEDEDYKKLLRLHTVSGAAIERINNNDTDFNYFSNERTRVNEKTGEVRNEELDGVTKKCCMGWSYNPGFKFGKYNGKTWMTPNNVNPSHIIPCDKKKR